MGRELNYHARFTLRAARYIYGYFEKGIKQQILINIQGWTQGCQKQPAADENRHLLA